MSEQPPSEDNQEYGPSVIETYARIQRWPENGEHSIRLPFGPAIVTVKHEVELTEEASWPGGQDEAATVGLDETE